MKTDSSASFCAAIWLQVIFGGFVIASASDAMAKFVETHNGLHPAQARMGDSLYDLLHDDASIHCGRIVDRTETSKKDANVHYGLVTIEVTETLVGQPIKRLVLPYSFSDPAKPGILWPDLSVLPKNELFCVYVMKGYYDRTALDAPDNLVAVRIDVSSDLPKDDRPFAEIRRIIEYDKQRENQTKKARLEDIIAATTRPSYEMRKYAFDELVEEHLDGEPELVMDVIGKRMSKAAEYQLEDVVGSYLDVLKTVANNEDLAREKRTAALHVLAELCGPNKCADVQILAMTNLARIVGGSYKSPTAEFYRNPNADRTVFPATDVLSKNEIAQFRAALTSAAKNDELSPVARQIQMWIDQTSGDPKAAIPH